MVVEWFWQGNSNFIKLPGTRELKKMLPSLRRDECLPSPALASPACKLWELEKCVCGYGGDHFQFNSLKPSCVREQQDPQEDLLRYLLVSTFHFSRCVAFEFRRVPGAWAGRSQGFLTSAASRSTAGPMEAGVLPEHQHYGISGFKQSASSLLSVFHYLCLKRHQKYSCSDGLKPALHCTPTCPVPMQLILALQFI